MGQVRENPNTGTPKLWAQTPDEVMALKKARRERALKKMRKYNATKKAPMPVCPATTRAGNPCPAKIATVLIRGKTYRLKTCVMHASELIRRELGVAMGSPIGGIPGSGRKPKPTAMSILRERFEAEADRYLKPYEDALSALKANVVGNGGSAHLEFTPDVALQLKAANDILDRIYGRPKQVTELSGFEGGPVEVQVPNDEERAKGLAQILASTGALNTVLTPSIPQNASASAPTTN